MYTARTFGRTRRLMLMKRWLGFAAILVLLAAPAAGRERAPRGSQGQLQFGIDMAQRGLWSEALFRFRQAERLGDDRTAVLNNIAVAYEALGQFDQAQEYYKKALEGDPGSAGLKRNYSRFVEFYQSFKPDQPAASPAEDAIAAPEDAAAPSGDPPEPPGDLPPPLPEPPGDLPEPPASPPQPTFPEPSPGPADPTLREPSASSADPSSP